MSDNLHGFEFLLQGQTEDGDMHPGDFLRFQPVDQTSCIHGREVVVRWLRLFGSGELRVSTAPGR